MCISNYVEYYYTSEQIKPLQISRYTGKSSKFPKDTFLIGNYCQNMYQFVKVEDRIIPNEYEYIKLTQSEISSLKIRRQTQKSDYSLFKNYKFDMIFDRSDKGIWIKKIPL